MLNAGSHGFGSPILWEGPARINCLNALVCGVAGEPPAAAGAHLRCNGPIAL